MLRGDSASSTGAGPSTGGETVFGDAPAHVLSHLRGEKNTCRDLAGFEIKMGVPV
jgi:hypothetical protein